VLSSQEGQGTTRIINGSFSDHNIVVEGEHGMLRKDGLPQGHCGPEVRKKSCI
jgi:hypothetical protein